MQLGRTPRTSGCSAPVETWALSPGAASLGPLQTLSWRLPSALELRCSSGGLLWGSGTGWGRGSPCSSRQELEKRAGGEKEETRVEWKWKTLGGSGRQAADLPADLQQDQRTRLHIWSSFMTTAAFRKGAKPSERVCEGVCVTVCVIVRVCVNACHMYHWLGGGGGGAVEVGRRTVPLKLVLEVGTTAPHLSSALHSAALLLLFLHPAGVFDIHLRTSHLASP